MILEMKEFIAIGIILIMFGIAFYNFLELFR